MKDIKLVVVFAFFLGLSIEPLFAQESILKNLVESKRDSKYCFYPSTLRMINVKKNEAYNELVSGVDKFLIYTLDSIARVDKSYRNISDQYLQAGFDEYATIFGGEFNMSIVGKEHSGYQEYVGYFDQKGEMVVAFYLRGNIPWQKIPTLIQNMNEMDMLDLFDFKELTF